MLTQPPDYQISMLCKAVFLLCFPHFRRDSPQGLTSFCRNRNSVCHKLPYTTDLIFHKTPDVSQKALIQLNYTLCSSLSPRIAPSKVHPSSIVKIASLTQQQGTGFANTALELSPLYSTLEQTSASFTSRTESAPQASTGLVLSPCKTSIQAQGSAKHNSPT